MFLTYSGIKGMDMLSDKIFSKRNTNIIKGAAILILCWHHLFWSNVAVPLDLKNTNAMEVLVPLTKVCVALFTMLSGYGINESYKKSNKSYGKFNFVHVKKLLINYWWIYVPVFLLSFWLHTGGTPVQIYGSGGLGIRNFLLDFLGLRALIYSPTLNNTWWYMEAAIIFYLCFPIFHKALNKIPEFVIGISALPVLLASVNIFWDKLITTDRELFYVFPFVVGMELSRREILNKMVRYCERNRREFIVLSCFFLVILGVIRTQISFIADTFYAFSILSVGIGIASFENIILKALEFLGKHSMNIFLIHSMVYYYFTSGRKLFDSIDMVLLKYVLLIVICLGGSMIIETVKKYVRRLRTNSLSE